MTSRLHERYSAEVVPALQKQFEYGNPNQVPKVSKIVVNIGLGEALTNAKALDAALGDLTAITGQKPIVTKARRSIAQFHVRAGNSIGAKVTLRGERMWDFLDRLTTLALPRIRDFRGIPDKSFDGRGNYSLGLREQLIFPEIDYDKIDKIRGMEITVVTTANTDEEARRLFTSVQQAFANMVRGTRGRLQPPIDDIESYWTPVEKAHASNMLSCSVVGSPETVRRGIAALSERTRADEFIVAAAIYDHKARLRSYEILAEVA